MSDENRLRALMHDETTVDQSMLPFPTLLGLWTSTTELYERFSAYPPSVSTALRVFSEAYGEVLLVMNRETCAQAPLKHALAQEAASLMTALFALLMAYGVTLRDLQDAMRVVIARDARKTSETHHVDPHTGKIEVR